MTGCGGGYAVGGPQRCSRAEVSVRTVSTHLRVEGQGLVGGGEIAVRDNHSLRIVQRQPDGHRLIVSEMYMDARTDATYSTS